MVIHDIPMVLSMDYQDCSLTPLQVKPKRNFEFRISNFEFSCFSFYPKPVTRHYNRPAMETRTRLLHKLVGVVTVLTFLGTGAYMRSSHRLSSNRTQQSG